MSKTLMLITFTGRMSGKQFTTPVAYVRDGDRLIVGVAEPETKRWWRNLREPAEVRLRIGSDELVGTARAVVDDESAHLASLLQRLVERHPRGGQVIGVSAPVTPADVAGCVAVEILVD
ncbi:MAG: nitroreductase family deazaflavin-dependent oxidoreductase [Myxococcota bacterium]|nr:nitroreductase family deazaflavin-dependent oxidoreductase [Myxococcota bacterium]